MNDFFDYTSYKKLVTDWVESQPKQGHGQFRKMAERISISTALMSQIFRGTKDLSFEHGWELTEYMGLTKLQSEYFMTLLQFERAGTHKLKTHFKEKLDQVRGESRKIKNRVHEQKKLTPLAQSVFYSHWSYSAIRLLTSIGGYDSATAISQKLKLPMAHVQKVLEFLLNHDLVQRQGNKFKMGATKTHLPADSEYIHQRHTSWRSIGFERMPHMASDEMFFTNVVTLSKEDVQNIRKELLKLIEKVDKIVIPSDSQELCCLNIDWFRV
jgi:uncharacterized protein (TIGR02147 family)